MRRFLLFAVIFASLGSLVSFLDILLYNVRTVSDLENKYTQLFLNFLMDIKHPGSYLSQRISSQQNFRRHSQQSPHKSFHYLDYFEASYGKGLIEEYLRNYTIAKQKNVSPTTTSGQGQGQEVQETQDSTIQQSNPILNSTVNYGPDPVEQSIELDAKIDACLGGTLRNLAMACPRILDYYNQYPIRRSRNYWGKYIPIPLVENGDSEDPSVANNQLELDLSYNLTSCSIYMEDKHLVYTGKPRFEPHTFDSCPRHLLHPNGIYKCVNLLPHRKFRDLFFSYFGGLRSICNSLQSEFEAQVASAKSFVNEQPDAQSTLKDVALNPGQKPIVLTRNFKFQFRRPKLFSMGFWYSKVIMLLSDLHDALCVILSFYYSALNHDVYPNHFVYKIWFYLRLAAALIIFNKICFKFLSLSRSGLEYIVVFIMAMETLLVEKYFNFPTNILPYTDNFNADDVSTLIDRFRVYGVFFILAVVVKLRLRFDLLLNDA